MFYFLKRYNLAGLQIARMRFSLFLLLLFCISDSFGFQKVELWHSPLDSIAISKNQNTNLTTLYPRLDKIVGRSIHLYGHYSPAELHLLSRPEFMNTTAVEVGAHIGALSAAMSRAVGHSGVIISVEPNPFFADLAAANIALNSNARSVVLLSAASNETKMGCLRSAALEEWQVADLKANSVSRFFAMRDRASRGNKDDSQSVQEIGGDQSGVITVMPLNLRLHDKDDSPYKKARGISMRDALSHNIRQCASTGNIYSDVHLLDALVAHAAKLVGNGEPLPPLSLIRIDAEGLDGAVIQGAMAIIRAQSPVVIFEAEYRDPQHLSHFGGWERAMAEYSVQKGRKDAPKMLRDIIADVSGTASTVQALQLLLCEANAGYTCYAAMCPVR